MAIVTAVTYSAKMSDNNGSDGTSSGTWSGLVSSLVFSLLITAIVVATITCCSIPCREFFFPRKYLVRKRIVTTQQRAAAVQTAPSGADGTTTGSSAAAAATPLPVAQAPPSVRFERVANPRYPPPVPSEFNPLAPVLMPWLGLCGRWRLHLLRGDSWASLHGPWSLLQHTSLDAHMLDVLHQLALVWSLCNLVLAIPVALVCAIGTPPPDDPLYNLSTARLPQGSGRLWVVFGALALSVAILLMCLHVGYREYERQRIRWLSVLTPASYSILLTGVPAAAANALHAPASPVPAAGSATRAARGPNGTAAVDTLAAGSGGLDAASVATDGAVQAAALGYQPPVTLSPMHAPQASNGSAPDAAGAAEPGAVAVRLVIAPPAAPPKRPALTLFASLRRPMPPAAAPVPAIGTDASGPGSGGVPVPAGEAGASLGGGTTATAASGGTAPLRSPTAATAAPIQLQAAPGSGVTSSGTAGGGGAPAVEMLIAQARRSRRLHRYASAFAEAADEWEKALARHAAAADPAHESYGKLEVLASHRSKVPGRHRGHSHHHHDEDQVDGNQAATGTGVGAEASGDRDGGHHRDDSTTADEEADRKFTVSEAVARLEARTRARYVKLQLLRRLYDARALEPAAASAQVDALAAGIAGPGGSRHSLTASGTAASGAGPSVSPSDTASSPAVEEGLVAYDRRQAAAVTASGAGATTTAGIRQSPLASPAPSVASDATSGGSSASPAPTPALDSASGPTPTPVAPPLSSTSLPAASGETPAPAPSGNDKSDVTTAKMPPQEGLQQLSSSATVTAIIAGEASSRERRRMERLLQAARRMSVETAAREGLVKPAFKLRVGVSDTAFITLLQVS